MGNSKERKQLSDIPGIMKRMIYFLVVFEVIRGQSSQGDNMIFQIASIL